MAISMAVSVAKPAKCNGSNPFEVSNALKLAANYAWDDVHDDGHWYGELRSNATITAEFVMLYQALGLMESTNRDRAALCQWLLSDQSPD